MMNESSRKKALVTGASAGIGEGFARHLARRNFDLVLVARRRDRLEQLAGELGPQHGASVEVLEADLAADGGVSAVEGRVRAGDIDVVVNNAGFGTIGEFASLPIERELEEIEVNVRALVRLTHAALAVMVPRGRGNVINVASTAAFQPVPYNATYSATKAFVLHFSEAVHEEVRSKGVTVTCLCPGPVKTEFQEVAGIADRRIPAMAWTSVDTVIESALAAARRGRALAIPGPLNFASANSTRLVPRFLVRRIAGAIFREQAGVAR
jgi:short-subunit dehydrogenase